MTEPTPKTLAEQLDAAETPEAFGNVILDLFGWLQEKRDEEWEA